jgi:hypothetical protein
VFASAVEAGVIGGLVIEKPTLRTLTIGRGLAAVGRGMCEVVATLALLDRFGLSRDADGDGFSEEEVT